MDHQHAFLVPTPAAATLIDIARPPTFGPDDILHIPHLRLILTTLLPATVALVVFSYDLLARIPYPRAVRRVAHILARPFRNFITFEDLDEPTPCPIGHAPWKARALAAGAVAESIGWLAVLAYKEETGDWTGSVRAAVNFLAWSFAFVRVLVKPPVTPPYLPMCFYAVCGLAALYDLWTDYAVSGGARWGMVALDAVLSALGASVGSWRRAREGKIVPKISSARGRAMGS